MHLQETLSILWAGTTTDWTAFYKAINGGLLVSCWYWRCFSTCYRNRHLYSDLSISLWKDDMYPDFARFHHIIEMRNARIDQILDNTIYSSTPSDTENSVNLMFSVQRESISPCTSWLRMWVCDSFSARSPNSKLQSMFKGCVSVASFKYIQTWVRTGLR